MQVAWSAGALSHALNIPFVRGAIVSACAEELAKQREEIKKKQLVRVLGAA